jgi:hypothetical protein
MIAPHPHPRAPRSAAAAASKRPSRVQPPPLPARAWGISEFACGVRIWPQSRRRAVPRTGAPPRPAPERTGAHWRAPARLRSARWSAPVCTGAQAGVQELRQRGPRAPAAESGLRRFASRPDQARSAMQGHCVQTYANEHAVQTIFTLCLPKSMATALKPKSLKFL